MAGRVRPLVPFFVSAPDGTLAVNDTPPVVPTPTSQQSSSPLIQLSVRTWDHSQGLFQDSVHFVRDLPQHLSATTAPTSQSSSRRLLTPAEIRLARRKKKHIIDANAPNVQPISAAPSPPKPDVVPVATLTKRPSVITPLKPRAYAGSTFEAASPPPHGLPIPAFARRARAGLLEEEIERRTPFETVEIEPDAMEKAAGDLRRMLRI